MRHGQGVDRVRLEQTVIAVEGSNPVGFSHGWIVERCIDEVLKGVVRSRLLHDRLSDMNDFRRIGSEAMNAQNFQRLAVEEDL